MLWRCRSHTLDLTCRGVVMGIVNVTEDSFSDGGRFFDPARAVAHALQLAAEGAEILDIGGESTRPGAEPVPEEEELRRVLPVIERLVESRRARVESVSSAPSTLDPRLSTLLSIDTMKPRVARAAIEAGADIVNDVTGLRDPAMRAVVRETGAGAVAMHMQGEPRTMQAAPHYDDVVAEVRAFFGQTLAACLTDGLVPEQLVFDPGIGFGKTLAHNLALLRSLESLQTGGRPLALGVSRKSFIGKVLGSAEMDDREWPTVALTSFGRRAGARLFRVHAVRPNVDALRMTEAILNENTASAVPPRPSPLHLPTA